MKRASLLTRLLSNNNQYGFNGQIAQILLISLGKILFGVILVQTFSNSCLMPLLIGFELLTYFISGNTKRRATAACVDMKNVLSITFFQNVTFRSKIKDLLGDMTQC